MSNKGYGFEHEIERALMDVCNQTPDMQLSQRTYRVPTSGAMRGEKGDIRTRFPWDSKQWMIECKARRQKSVKGSYIRLEKAWFKKCEEEAKEVGMIPVLAFSFKGKTKNRIWFIFWKSMLPSCINSDYSSLEARFNNKSVTIHSNKICGDLENGFSLEYMGETFICLPLQRVLSTLRTVLNG